MEKTAMQISIDRKKEKIDRLSFAIKQAALKNEKTALEAARKSIEEEVEEDKKLLDTTEREQLIESFNDGYVLAASILGGIENATAPPFVGERRYSEKYGKG